MKTLGAYLIVKDEEVQIKECLDSILPICDEIIVVDTGCKDKTMDIVASYNDGRIKTYYFEWINDFSAARNFAMSKTVSDYTFTTDADEVFPENLQKKILELKASDFHECSSIEMSIRNNNNGQYTYYLGGRQIVRRSANNIWRYRIHEKLYYNEDSTYIINVNDGFIIHNSNVAESNYNKYAEIYYDELKNPHRDEYLAHFYYYLYFTLKDIDELTAKTYLYHCYESSKIKSLTEDQRLTLYADGFITIEDLYCYTILGNAKKDADSEKLIVDVANTFNDNMHQYILLKYLWDNDMIGIHMGHMLNQFAYISYRVGMWKEFINVTKYTKETPYCDVITNHNLDFIDNSIIPFRKNYEFIVERTTDSIPPSKEYLLGQYLPISSLKSIDDAPSGKTYIVVDEHTQLDHYELLDIMERILFNKELNTSEVKIVKR